MTPLGLAGRVLGGVRWLAQVGQVTPKLDPRRRLQPHLIKYQILLCRHTRLLGIWHTLPRVSKLTLRAASLLEGRFEGLSRRFWQLAASERLQIAFTTQKVALANRDLLDLLALSPFANLRPVKLR